MSAIVVRERKVAAHLNGRLEGRVSSRFFSELHGDGTLRSQYHGFLDKAEELGKTLTETEGIDVCTNAEFADAFALARDYHSRYASPIRLKLAGLKSALWNTQTRTFGAALAEDITKEDIAKEGGES